MSTEILIIDDNSPDKTSLEVKNLQKIFPNLFLKNRPHKQGLGTAYIDGFSWAIKKNYHSIVQMDADLSHDPKDVASAVEFILNDSSRAINGQNLIIDDGWSL